MRWLQAVLVPQDAPGEHLGLSDGAVRFVLVEPVLAPSDPAQLRRAGHRLLAGAWTAAVEAVGPLPARPRWWDRLRRR